MIRAGDIASAIGAAIVPPSGLGRKPRADGSSGSAVGTAPAAIRGLHAEGGCRGRRRCGCRARSWMCCSRCCRRGTERLGG